MSSENQTLFQLLVNLVIAIATVGYTILTYRLWMAASSQAKSAREMLDSVSHQSQNAARLAQLSADAVISASLSVHFEKLAGSGVKFQFAEEAAAFGITPQAIRNGYVLGNTPYAVLKDKNLEEGRRLLEEAIQRGADRYRASVAQ